MSDFTDSLQGPAENAWRAVGAFPAKYNAWKKAPGPAGRAQRGCLGVLIFGLVYVFVPLCVFLVVESALVAWALLLSTLWLVGAGVDALKHRKDDNP